MIGQQITELCHKKILGRSGANEDRSSKVMPRPKAARGGLVD
jgi:hypothetical protein